MRYQPVNSFAEVEALAAAPEDRSCDFKADVDPKKWWELAKDIAAFANHVGGTILVGADAQPDKTVLCGVTRERAKTLQLAYRNAAKDSCNPPPLIEAPSIDLPGKHGRAIVAVNVEPFPLGPVGARFYRLNKNGACVPGDAWLFPVRVGEDNLPLQPDQIAMFMEPRTRRIVTLLEAIPQKERDKVILSYVPGNGGQLRPMPVRLVDVDVLRNTFFFARLLEFDIEDDKQHGVPLDDVEAVWQATKGEWCVRVTGYWEDAEIWGDRYVSGPGRYGKNRLGEFSDDPLLR